MISLEKCKELLGDETLTEDDIEEIRDSLYESAQIAFEVFYADDIGSKNPVWSLSQLNKNDTI